MPSTSKLFYVVFLVNKGDSSYDWAEKFAACVIDAPSEDEAYKRALLALPRAIGYHRECGEAPDIKEEDEKDCVVDVTPMFEFTAQLKNRWEDIRTWEESPPF